MCAMKPEELQKLQTFIESCQSAPQILHIPELQFFRDYVESLGGKIPSAEKPSFNATNQETPKPETTAPPRPATPEPVSEESDIEIDTEGVLEEETSAPPEKGDASKEVSEEDQDAANEKRGEAMSALSEGNLDTAVDLFTEAVKLNPLSAMLYAKRASILLKQKRVKAALIDCEEAVKLNPDSAPAYKFRGRTNTLLGNWLQAAADLRLACKLDFDEQASEWLAEVQPKASKLEEHNRKYERKRKEKEIDARKERVKNAQDAAKKAQEEQKKSGTSFPGGMPDGMPGGGGGMPGGGGGGVPNFAELFKDPEILAAMQDPEVAAAFQDVSSNPANIFKYQNNPKVSAIINKLISNFGGAGGMGGGMPGGMGGGMPGGMGGGMPGGMGGGMPGGMGGFPGGMGGFPPGMEDILNGMRGGGSTGTPPSKNSSDDLD